MSAYARSDNAQCERTTVCVLRPGHEGRCQRAGGVVVVTTADRLQSDGYEEERLGYDRAHKREVAETAKRAQAAELAEAQQHSGFLESALDDIAQKALHAKGYGSMATGLIDIHNAAEAALQRPREGTRVRCLMPHRGKFGTVTGWDRDLGVALVTWDDLSGLPPEGVEPGEYEAIS